MTDLSNALAGLSLLAGTDASSALAASTPTVLTKAQRKAKAAFTTAATTAPWKQPASNVPVSAQVSAIKSMATIIDKSATGAAALPDDVQTSFTTYRALDRLQKLAEAAAKDTTGSAERTALQKAFGKGLSDLKTFLGSAPSTLVDLSFARSARELRTAAVAAPSSLSAPSINGKGIRDTRTGALEGVTGTEVLRIDLSQPGGAANSVTVDLSTAPQPPTLDGVADAINAAIKAIPRRDANGAVVLDANGDPVPRWGVSVEPTKTGDKWGLSIKRAGFETVSIDQIGARDALMVAGGVTADDAPGYTRVSRLNDPDGAMSRVTYGTLTAKDTAATERSKSAADADTTGELKAVTVAAGVTARAMATDAQGFGYVVGTSAGDLGSNVSNGTGDLFLTKVDSEGNVVWQRTLGAAGSSDGAAVSIAPDGGIVVAGSVSGTFDGAASDGDMMVARYDTEGNETFSTLVRKIGSENGTAVAVGHDGSIFVGGNTAGGNAVVARVDASGVLKERREIDSGGADTLKAIAIGVDGNPIALTREGGSARLRKLNAASLATELGSLDLGRADARALAVSSDGTVAVVGATDTPLSGTQVNGSGGKRDAFLARVDGALSRASVTYIGTAAEDQADSVAFMGNAIYVGGRTAGAFAGAKTGTVDAFVARVDAATGALGTVSQWGTIGARSDAVEVAAASGGNSVLGALGLHRGTLTPTDSVTLEAQTSLRAGDEFSIKVNGGAARKIVIDANETLTTLSAKIGKIAGTQVAGITTPLKDAGRSLQIMMKPGNEIELIAGGSGKDALGKLGLDPRRISAPAELDDDAPKVRPGGSFGLDLSDALRIDNKTDAAVAVARIKQAVSYTQSAYRSLYWDDTKAALADTSAKGGKTGGSTAIEQAQLANYQAALTRLSATSGSTTTSLYGF